MPRPPAKNPRLNDRDYEIFQHIMRYRLSTREALHKLFFSDSEPNAVTKVTSRLTEHGFLNRFELYPPRTYFVLGPQAVRIMGVAPKKTKELGPQALIREYATLGFCCLGPQTRVRLTVREIQARNPYLLHKNLDSSHYYLDHDGETPRLGYIRVDYGGPPEHIIRKCRQDVEIRYPNQAFTSLMDEGRFLIAIVTGREEKVAAIHECLKRFEWKVRFRIEVLPDLVELIARFQSAI